MLFSRPTLANLVNVTVDDAGSDPYTGAQIVYSPSNAWSLGPACTVCTAHPDPKRAFNGTWHDGFFDPNTNNVLTASFQFDGSALYVNCILSHLGSNPDGTTNMLFFLDGEFMGSYQQFPNGDPTYEFNTMVYANSSIPNGHHTFTIQNGQLQAPGSLVLLDSIMYTRDVSQNVTSALPSSSRFISYHQTSLTKRRPFNNYDITALRFIYLRIGT
ncbi:hypothetical protein QCA50_001385 [Cerrena zonata]|uniref:Uncharacterized protein n=1 Tax=Cerrena zonata TaxID=2478898 RepID=A0AAW0GT55_9APHY